MDQCCTFWYCRQRKTESAKTLTYNVVSVSCSRLVPKNPGANILPCVLILSLHISQCPIRVTRPQSPGSPARIVQLCSKLNVNQYDVLSCCTQLSLTDCVIMITQNHQRSPIYAVFRQRIYSGEKGKHA